MIAIVQLFRFCTWTLFSFPSRNGPCHRTRLHCNCMIQKRCILRTLFIHFAVRWRSGRISSWQPEARMLFYFLKIFCFSREPISLCEQCAKKCSISNEKKINADELPTMPKASKFRSVIQVHHFRKVRLTWALEAHEGGRASRQTSEADSWINKKYNEYLENKYYGGGVWGPPTTEFSSAAFFWTRTRCCQCFR